MARTWQAAPRGMAIRLAIEERESLPKGLFRKCDWAGYVHVAHKRNTVMQIVAVKFSADDGEAYRRDGNKLYHYFYTGAVGIKKGDHVVVDVSGKYKLVKVEEVLDSDKRHLATKPIVNVVDDSEYKDELERAKKRLTLIKELEKMRERQDQVDRYRMLEGNPEAAELLEQLKLIDAGATPRQRILEDIAKD